MKLIIVESPTKANTLSRFLGSGYEIDSTKGHIKDLPKSKLGVDTKNDFKADYVIVEGREKVIEDICKKAKRAEITYIATDPDREGEAIASHVEDIIKSCGKKSNVGYKRITFHEITKEAVEEAINNPLSVNRNLVDAQIARRVLDRLVGYSLSPVLWKKVRRGLSAGRVQSVAVRLIVEKEEEISKFKPSEYWDIFALLGNTKKQEFKAQLVKQDVTVKKDADKILKDLEKANYRVQDVSKRQITKHPYAPFTTSTLTQSAARIFGWSAKRTMRTAQGLYEEGLITYHRTDSLNLSASAVNKAREYIKSNFGISYIPEKAHFYKTKSKTAQEAHEAIRPTDIKNIPSKLGVLRDTKRLYDLIFNRFLACQMNPAIYDETTIKIEAQCKQYTPGVSKHTPGVYLLRTSGQIMKFDGWRRIIPVVEGLDPVVLPDVFKGENLSLVKVWGDQKFTQPPARYNEASLIKILEKLGIGRPSTYAPIISTIQIRSYVDKKEGKFFPTPVGAAVIKFLSKYFDEEIDYGFTADMEKDLDVVAEGKLNWIKMMKKFWKPFEKKVEKVTKNAKRVKIEVEKLGKKCPDCKDGELVIRVGRFGKFISCSNFPDCKHTEKYLEKIGIKCPDCKKGEVIVKKSKKGIFYGCSRYPECKWASWKKPKKEGEN